MASYPVARGATSSSDGGVTEIALTPVQVVPRAGRELGLDLRVKRDDLLPASGGGNKVRKAARIFAEGRTSGTDAAVTTGGMQSNHARVCALEAARLGWPAHLVLHGDPKEAARPTGNLLLMMLAGAEIVIVDPAEIADAMTRAADSLRSRGYDPLVIPGGGHSLQGAVAYADAVTELALQCGDWIPDHIVLASGTGATQAGIIAGCRRLGWSTDVLGISVARRNPRARDVVLASLTEISGHLEVEVGAGDVHLYDEWVGEGYEHADDSILSTIRTVATGDGLILDPTYTGKAFTGLRELVHEGVIDRGSRVLFWHTGGLLNLLSSPYF